MLLLVILHPLAWKLAAALQVRRRRAVSASLNLAMFKGSVNVVAPVHVSPDPGYCTNVAPAQWLASSDSTRETLVRVPAKQRSQIFLGYLTLQDPHKSVTVLATSASFRPVSTTLVWDRHVSHRC